MSASKTNTHTDFLLRKLANSAPDQGGRRESLTTTVEAAVGSLDENALSPLAGGQRLSAVDAKRLLALLSWSYARELYSSAEIHSRLRRGGTAELWECGIPSVADICRFRMENRRALESCLRSALHFLAVQKMAAGLVTRINEACIAAEAGRRIITAIFIDNTEATALATL